MSAGAILPMRVLDHRPMRELTMDCEKCGAEIPEGAETCPECGEPVAAVSPEPAPQADTFAEPISDAKPAGGGKRIALIAAVVLVIAAVIGGAIWFIQGRVTAAASPEAAAKAMLAAYANYDAQGILDNATHASLAASDVAQFSTQAAEAKARAKNVPSVKNVVVGKVTLDTADKNKATVDVTAEWLDPATGKYSKRTEKLIVVKQDGKWLVQLF